MSVRPQLTRRGRVVALVAVAGTAMGWWYGGRALNAVVVPAVTLLLVGFVTLGRGLDIEFRRRTPRHGYVGDAIHVELDVLSARPWTATVTDDVPDGLDGDGRSETVLDGDTLAYDLHLAERGIYTVGPTTVTIGDVFGLWERTVEDTATDTVVAFPPVRPLHESADLLSGYVGLTDEREQFDTIREYERGDALRDVNWKASAKRSGDLVVTEFAGQGATSRVTVGVEAPKHRADSSAEAAASVAAHLLDAGLEVGIVTPDVDVTPGAGGDTEREILTALARFDPGRLSDPDREAVDVVVSAPGSGRHVRIEVNGASHRFGEFVTASGEREGAA